MRSLIIGRGQIGQALLNIFSRYHETQIRDIEPVKVHGQVEILHIAYPYSEDFVRYTVKYMDEYKPKLTMIHSSVKIGTTDLCGEHVVHTPERGRHPNLDFEMREFPKFVAGRDCEDVRIAEQYFVECEWPVHTMFNPQATELYKLASNVHLALEVAWRQTVERMIEQIGHNAFPRLGYEEWEDSYNRGHRSLGQQQLLRPRLKPGPIGGHCLLPCLDILSESFKSPFFKAIKESNEKAQDEQRERDSDARETETVAR